MRTCPRCKEGVAPDSPYWNSFDQSGMVRPMHIKCAAPEWLDMLEAVMALTENRHTEWLAK